ncbi:MAG: sialidase family protein [Acidobacteriaceae bacterium]
MQMLRRIGIAFVCIALVHALDGATGTHLPESTLYPRLLRLQHAPSRLQNSILAKTGNKLFRSLDDGRTFTFLTSVPTVNLEQGSPAPDRNVPDKERCCSTIFELPRTLRHLKAGTLLYSGSFFSGGVPAIEIFTSVDQGEHWQHLSTPVRGGDQHHGLWEPEFTLARNGSLVLFFSDETDPCCSQKLVAMYTRDGRRWSSRQDIVASASQKDRPGMAVVSRLPSQTYLLSYEICGPVAHCEVYTRTSGDGLDYGSAASYGIKAVSLQGQYFAHAPTNVYDPASRRIFLAGQVLFEHDGSVSRQNGKVLFTTTALDGTGAWETVPAPVEVPTAYDNYCPNYSSALMPTSRGLLEVASDYDAAHLCTSYFATQPGGH